MLIFESNVPLNVQGFSLLEMLLVFALIAILSMLSFNSLRFFNARSDAQILQQQLSQAIELARASARSKRTPVILCGLATKTLTCAQNWDEGELIFVDSQSAGAIDNNATIIQVLQRTSARGKLFFQSFPRYRNYLVFKPTGLTQNDNGTFWYCRWPNTPPAWAIIINKSGRQRTVWPNPQGLVLDNQGRAFKCSD